MLALQKIILKSMFMVLVLGVSLCAISACSRQEDSPATTSPTLPRVKTPEPTAQAGELLLIYQKQGGFDGRIQERLVVGTDLGKIRSSRIHGPVGLSKEYLITPAQTSDLLNVLRESRFFKLGQEKKPGEDYFQLEMTLTISQGVYVTREYQSGREDEGSPINKVVQAVQGYLQKHKIAELHP